MNTIMGTIVAFLGILGAQLIYSLMLSDVEDKTFQFGMLRALGFSTKNLILTILVQGFTFAIPGLISGMFMAVILNFGMREVLYTLTQNTSTYWLSGGSEYLGIIFGILMPLCSNIIPIQRALGKNLRASLDMYQRSVGELDVQIKSLEHYGLSLNQLLASIMLVVLGILTYFVAPQAFLFKDFELFFGIMNSLLLLMILGLTFLTILIFPYLERLFVNLFLWSPCGRKDKKLKDVIMKNLQSHKRRNLKTAIMFSICLSFLIFAGSTFNLIGHLIISQLETSVGADLYGVTIDTVSLKSMLDDRPISAFLQDQKDEFGDVESWTFASHNLAAVLKVIAPKARNDIFFSDFTGYVNIGARIFSMCPNYLQTVNLKYFVVNEIEEDLTNLPNLPGYNIPDVVKSLYSN